MLNEIDLYRVNLNLLVLFETVLRERHVGRASERLNLSASAVSHGLDRLRRLLNDPLFIRSPKGVVPTERALALATPIGDVLNRARLVISSAEPFNPASSVRRFIIGALDSITASLITSLLADVLESAPRIDLSFRNVTPTHLSWEIAYADLDQRVLDVAILPFPDDLAAAASIPARFFRQCLFEESFVVTMRRGHPYSNAPGLDAYCASRHIIVSDAAESFGYVDHVLAGLGRSRRVALTVASSLMALSAAADSDLLVALPKSFLEKHARRFDAISLPMPMALSPSFVHAIAPHAAMTDGGMTWLIDALQKAAPKSG